MILERFILPTKVRFILFLNLHIFLGFVAFNPAEGAADSGRDALQNDSEAMVRLRKARVALMAHAASRDQNGEHLLDWAVKNKVNLTQIFSAEHGFWTNRDDLFVGQGAQSFIQLQSDSKRRIPHQALYTLEKISWPTLAARFELVLIDLFDVGMRPYTYPASLCALMRGLASLSSPRSPSIWILNRPNPLGELQAGPTPTSVAERPLFSQLPLRYRHGLTLGDTAHVCQKTYPETQKIEVRIFDPTVSPLVRSSGQSSADQSEGPLFWTQFGKQWTPPSPSIGSFGQLAYYLFLQPLEFLDWSVGREKDPRWAFRRFGAPWITPKLAEQMVTRLNQLHLPKVSFSVVEFTPDRREFAGEKCRGFEVQLDTSTESFLEQYRFEWTVSVIRSIISTLRESGRKLPDLKPLVQSLGLEGAEANL